MAVKALSGLVLLDSYYVGYAFSTHEYISMRLFWLKD